MGQRNGEQFELSNRLALPKWIGKLNSTSVLKSQVLPVLVITLKCYFKYKCQQANPCP